MPSHYRGQSHELLYSIAHDDYHAGEQVAKWIIKTIISMSLIGVSEYDVAVGRKERWIICIIKNNGMYLDLLSTFSMSDAQEVGKHIEVRDNGYWAATDNIALGIYHSVLNADYDMPKLLAFGNKITKIIAPIIQTVSFNYREGETSVEDYKIF